MVVMRANLPTPPNLRPCGMHSLPEGRKFRRSGRFRSIRRMRFTIGLPTDHVARADEFVTGEAVMECARVAEESGFDACFVTDHPAPDIKWLEGGGHHALDPFVALSFAAAATTRLRVQTHILVLPYRHPLPTP